MSTQKSSTEKVSTITAITQNNLAGSLHMKQPLTIISSQNGADGLVDAMEVLKQGGTAIDAVECGIRIVESNAEDHSVGYGGYPNIIGEVELDAALMEGKDLSSGAVGAIRHYKHPISIARKVMEKLPHVFRSCCSNL